MLRLGRPPPRPIAAVAVAHRREGTARLSEAHALNRPRGERAVLGAFVVFAVPGALAVKDYGNTQKGPLLISGFAVAESLTLQPNPYVFRLTYSAAMTGAPIGQWTYRHLKARKAAIIASDSVGPLELMMAWARAFEESGGKIVQEIYPPLGTADMAPWVAKLRQDVDVIGVQTGGAAGARLLKPLQ